MFHIKNLFVIMCLEKFKKQFRRILDMSVTLFMKTEFGEPGEMVIRFDKSNLKVRNET